MFFFLLMKFVLQSENNLNTNNLLLIRELARGLKQYFTFILYLNLTFDVTKL